MSESKCAACACALAAARTTVRKADGTVRFVLCNVCFERRFCRTCMRYFPSTAACLEHQCPN